VNACFRSWTWRDRRGDCLQFPSALTRRRWADFACPSPARRLAARLLPLLIGLRNPEPGKISKLLAGQGKPVAWSDRLGPASLAPLPWIRVETATGRLAFPGRIDETTLAAADSRESYRVVSARLRSGRLSSAGSLGDSGKPLPAVRIIFLPSCFLATTDSQT
jgi:hypothetical protein